MLYSFVIKNQFFAIIKIEEVYAKNISTVDTTDTMDMNATCCILPLSVYTDSEYNTLRRSYLILIGNLLQEHMIDDDISVNMDTVIDIEKSCYDDAVASATQELLVASFENLHFTYLYRTKISRITKRLDIDSEVGHSLEDGDFAFRLLNGHLNPKTISLLSNYELSPHRNKHLIDELDTRMTIKGFQRTSSLYRCPKCRHNETTVRSQQMRSLDESETLVITCTFCSHKWFN